MNKRIITTTELLKDLLQYFVKDTRGDKPWVDADDEWFNDNIKHRVIEHYCYSLYAVSVSDGRYEEWTGFDSYESYREFFDSCVKDGEDVHGCMLSPEGEYRVIDSYNTEDDE